MIATVDTSGNSPSSKKEFVQIQTEEFSSMRYATIAKSDTVDFDSITRGIYVGGTGNVAVVDRDGDAVVFAGVPAGTILPVQARRVDSTGTTATDMVAMF